RAVLLPRLRLPGQIQLSAAGIDSGSIVNTVSTSLAAMDDLATSGGPRKAGDELARARTRAQEAAFIYERTVLEALEQVESALIARRSTADQHRARSEAAAAAARALEQAHARYRDGQTDFSEVLDAERSWLA